MSIKLIPMKCPYCGANIENVNSSPFVTCAYCDTEFIVDHGELCKYEAPDVSVLYADNRPMEVFVELPLAKALKPAWIESTYHSLTNAITAFDSCAAIPLDVDAIFSSPLMEVNNYETSRKDA